MAKGDIRNFEVLYGNVDLNTFDFDKLEQRLESLSYITKWAYIVHDKDRNADGSIKHTHIHVMCQNKYALRISRIANDFNVKEQYIEKCKTRFANCIAYLTHETEKAREEGKHEYDRSDVKSNFNVDSEIDEIVNQNSLKKMKELLIDEILEGRVKEYNLNDFFKNYKIENKYKVLWNSDIQTAYKIRLKELARNMDRNMDILYIFGKTGNGKTTYAKALAKKKGYATFITGCSNDAFEGYEGQECIILDDLRSDTFTSFADALKIFDNNTSSRVKSRYNNKVLQAELMIVTSSISVTDLFRSLATSEDIKQIYRRINNVIYLDRDVMSLIKYDEQLGKYKKIKEEKNKVAPIIENFKKQEQTKIEDFII